MFTHISRSVVLIPLALTAVAALTIVCARHLQSSRDVLTRPAPPADHRIAYGQNEFQFGDLRLPKGEGRRPVAIVIHGGCWMSEYGLSYMGHLSGALAEAGVATWSVEYRRVGNQGGGWPGTFEDVARAADHLRTIAKTYPLDLNQVVAVGHSAGGHLALWLAARRLLPKDSSVYSPDPLPLRGVVSLAGVTDLRRTGTACDASVTQLMGGSPKDKAAIYGQASPIELLPLGIPSAIVQGSIDSIIPLAMAEDYADAAKKKGDDAKLVVIEKAGHFEVVDPKSFAWEAVRDEVLALLKTSVPAKSK
ncbi:MAG TPA: alpha/beta hydrolase [Blastocatellia bacterium]|jgi:acetyl esterase/lipase|nr:alpha/beta hydrolase [Blastocatellia bacterium]